MRETRNRLLPVLGSLALLPVVLAMAAAPAAAELKEDVKNNYVLDLPSGWTQMTATADWEKEGFVLGAVRRLAELADGKPAQGEGAQMFLSVMPAPKDQTLEQVAESKLGREFLLARFEGKPEIETITEQFGDPEPVPLLILRADGKARNLAAKTSPARAVLMLALASGNLYRLLMHAWHTEYDDEGLKSELDLIEVSFNILDTKRRPASDGAKEDGSEPPPPDEAAPEGPVAEGDSEEVVPFSHMAERWSIVKPKGITSKPVDREDASSRNTALMFGNKGNDYSIILYVYRNGASGPDGRVVSDQDLRKFMTTAWYSPFLAQHPDGPLVTFDWPRKSRKDSMLVFPDLEDRTVLAETPEKRKLEVDTAEMERLKIVEKVKDAGLGVKTIEAWRGAMLANRPRVGREIGMRFAWKTVKYSYLMEMYVKEETLPTYRAPLDALLASFKLEED